MMLRRIGLVLTALAVGSMAVPAVADTSPRVVFELGSPALEESSGLVDFGPLMVTMNDSGSDAVLYVLDARTGQTVGSTTYADAVVDVEALAPAGPGEVWAGDIGDNREARAKVTVYRVPVGTGSRRVSAPSYDLVYPDGPHDAESLIAGPSGRLYLVTKSLRGGNVYAAPRRLDPAGQNELVPVAGVSIWATDAALLAGGKFAIIRGYTTAAVCTFPDFTPIGSFALPPQRQGEGISVGPNGRIRLSSEGRHSAVLQVTLPAALAAPVAAGSATPSPAAEVRPTPVPDPVHQPGSPGSGAHWWLLGGAIVVLAGATSLLLQRRTGGGRS